MKVKPVFTWSPSERKVRLFRIIWDVPENALYGDERLARMRERVPQAYSAMVSFSLVPRLFKRVPTTDGFDITVLGLRAHHKKSYGGRFV